MRQNILLLGTLFVSLAYAFFLFLYSREKRMLYIGTDYYSLTIERMNQYELMVIIDPDIGNESIEKRLSKIRELIVSQKGEVTFEDIWGVRELAYNIKKKDRGHYAVLDFTMDGEGLREVETTLKLDNEVLRHMIVTLPPTYKSKSYLADLKDEEIVVTSPEKKDETKKTIAAKVVKKEEAAPIKETVIIEDVVSKKEPAVEKEKSPSLEEVDQKLKDIIDNPDLNF